MIVELGHFALILAFAVALAQAVIPMLGAHKGWRDWMVVANPLASLQFALVAFSYAALTYAFLVSDFSVKLVVDNSHTLKPLIYKISGVWGNHEGSMLLWVLTLTLFGACAAWFGGNLPASLQARVLAVQSAITAAFMAFTIFTSNPFTRLAFPPFDGTDLNPLLQDPGLAFHPPFLYLGYVGLSMSFSFAVAALIEGRVDAAWGRWVRPWTLAAWVFLTIGIATGSWWAYYELGWGGFWFWDPVENASLMPWLFAAALLHSAIVVEKRETLKSWTILLAILGFGFSLMGTFIVRSGLLTSVHAFAMDPERGVFILMILAAFMGGALTLFAFRAPILEAKGVFATISRESALVVNNVLLSVSSFVIFIGTMWPLVAEMLFDRVLTVGPPFFNTAWTPFMVALAMVLPIGSMLPWKRANLSRAMQPLWGLAVFSVAMGAVTWALQTGHSPMVPIGIALGLWVVLGASADLWMRTGRGALGNRLRRLARLPRADWGKASAHAGVGISVFAVAALLGWETEDIRVVQIGGTYYYGGYDLTLASVDRVQGPNYTSTMATIEAHREGRHITTLFPEKRFYPIAGMPTTQAAIDRSITRDLYITLGDPQDSGGWAVRTYIKPFANWLWFGCFMMALGGVLSLSDRRYRIAAGAARKSGPNSAVPAE
ncbi:MAG: heme lyase CcmF/NrfE family subunit [Rhodobacteraceae bacterium]|nr:heme lyase CcmF/NrfE family subunit [Paracoccaceae bacterium]